MSMSACPGCRRHVRSRDPICPFCGTAVRVALAPVAGALLSMVLACGPTFLEIDDGLDDSTSTAAESTSDDSGGPGGSGSGAPVTTSTASTASTGPMDGSTTDDGDSTSDSGAGFIYGGPDTSPPPLECDLFAQDCPDGERCAPWANDGGDTFNASRCSPVEQPPDSVGQACEYEGSHLSGLDSCDAGAVCLPSTIDANERACVALCLGDPANPYCEDPETTCVAPFGEHAWFCLPFCDPFQADGCATGQACAPFDDDWACVPTQGLAPGEACDGSDACATGSICLPADELGACASASCCSPLCNLGEPDPDAACTAPEQCEPYYEGAPFFGENVGVCRVE